MATAAQLAANRGNSQHSTGPTTADGKARASLNNLRHGFRSQSVLLPGDDPAEYEALLEELRDHFTPGDLTEDRHVREMADAEWRLRRVRHHHEILFTRRIGELAALHPGAGPHELQALAFDALHRESSSFAQLLRYETKFERQYERAYRAWTAYQRTKDQVAAQHEAARIRAFLDASALAPASALANLPDEPNSLPATPPDPGRRPRPSLPAPHRQPGPDLRSRFVPPAGMPLP
jgi:hypothetical protein